MKAIILGLALTSLIAHSAPADAGQGNPDKNLGQIRDFASDFSHADSAILSKVGGFIDRTPTEIEQIGFYGMEDAAPCARILLATVSLLDERGYLYSFEDKYMADIMATWIEDGILDPETLPPEAAGVFRPLFDLAFVDVIYDEGVEDTSVLADYVAYVDANYAQATLQLEEAVEQESGKVLLSVDATNGDTMFFALVSPAIAEKWRDTGFACQHDYAIGIRAPMWDYFWHNMVYALQLPTVGDTYTRPLPEGTRKRRETLRPPAK